MAFYLIDYENVNKDGMRGISQLTQSDTVCIFYSENASTMTFDLHERINQSKAHITFEKVDVKSKNALDFQLVSYLGYLIATNPDEQFTIISKDTGYRAATRFWQLRDVTITQMHDLTEIPVVSPMIEHTEPETEETLPEETPVEPVIAADPVVNTPVTPTVVSAEAFIHSDEGKKVIEELIAKNRTKLELNNALVKKYGSTRGGEIYNQVKSLVKSEPAPEPAVTSSKNDKEPVATVSSADSFLSAQKDEEEIRAMISKYKTKQGLNNALIKKFGNSRGGEIYKKIKPLLKDKKGK